MLFVMKVILGQIFRRIGNIFYVISEKITSRKVVPTLESIRVQPWLEAQGDKTHRVDYELNQTSMVLDLGGYQGQWAADIFCRYACTIHIFEPFVEFAKNIRTRFKNNSKVIVHEFGLTKANETSKLSISADCSSTFKPGAQSVEIQLVKIEDFMRDHQINFVDLMKINIEGGEYELLEHLTESDSILRFRNIQVQFHDFVPNAEARMKAIHLKMEKTHYLTYCYEFIWENWQIRE
jgi:FkbM family methyltransferase